MIYPQFTLSTAWNRVTVHPEEDSVQRLDRNEYLTVLYDAILDISSGDFVLQGRRDENDRYNFTVHLLKRPSDFTGHNPKNDVTYNQTTNMSTVDVQTEEPFAINKLVYSPDSPDNHCPIDLGNMYRKQPIFIGDGMNVGVQFTKQNNQRTFNIENLQDKDRLVFKLLG